MVRDDGTIVRQGGPPARKKMQAGQSNSGAKGFSKIRKTGADIMMVVCMPDWVGEV